MKTVKQQLQIRIDDEINEKLKMIAIKEQRSKNAQIEYILKKYVAEYEEANEVINISSHDNSTQHISINNK